ncbi:hypothetical protein ASD54_08620 [Rhizobium sp. Root149]|uniref:hypothetical protein n=1 Tax=Rhizobium sp. Root149 TaxID=1736473 RepID=UPI000713D275|nr:hypothetical protein [Rhizobium sp. Root149]KQZ50308.1 hypothetical protein ASD54_08620 [Rhizobium sp. Root149]
MLRRIAALLASAASKLINSLPTAGKWLDDLLSMPFRTVFGGGGGAPSYTPDVQTADLLNTLKDAREAAQAEAHRLDRNDIESVLEFAKAHRDTRATMSLPKTLTPEVRAALLQMDDVALRKLYTSGIGQVRKFLAAKPHGIQGVPSFGERLPTVADEPMPKGMTVHEAMVWKIRAKMLKPTESEPFPYPRKSSF